MFPGPFLADFAPLDAGIQGNAYSVLLVVGALVAMWAALRRKPPLETHLATFATAIEGLQKAVESLTTEQKKHSAHEAKIGELENKVRSLESNRDTDAAAQRRHLTYLQKEIFAKIESQGLVMQDKLDAFSAATQEKFSDFQESLSRHVQNTERGLGRIEGAFEQLKERLNHASK